MPDIAPNYFAVTEDGVIEATFPGSLTVPAATTGQGGAGGGVNNKVRWVTQPGGAMVAELYAFHDDDATPGTILTLRSYEPPGGGTTSAAILADPREPDQPFGFNHSTLRVGVDSTEAYAIASIGKGIFDDPEVRTILNDNGQSHYAQLPTALDVRFYAALLNVDGTPNSGTQRTTGGFTVTRLGTGRWQFTGDDPSRVYTILGVFCAQAVNADVFAITHVSNNVITYGINNIGATPIVVVDVIHSIIAMSIPAT